MKQKQAQRMARFCIQFGVTPDVYRSLSLLEYQAFYEELEHVSEN